MGFRSSRTGEGETDRSSSRGTHSTKTTQQQTTRSADRTTQSGSRAVPGPSHDYGSDEIPADIERQNFISVRRSARQAYHDGPAGDTGVPESVRRVVSSSGQSLDVSVQRAMEDRMGDSFGDVQIHTGSRAAAACEDINARAFTVGSHIAFNSGEYDPESAEGQHVLAHELAHVRQQTGGAVSMLPQDNVELEIDPDPALEREAEETAQRVMEGGELGIQRLEDTEVHVQRMSGVGRDETMTPGQQAGGIDTEAAATESGGVDLDAVPDGDAVADQVAVLTENQQTLADEVEGLKESAAEKVGIETGKGAMSGMATLAGAAVGVPFVGSVVGGALSGVYERKFDDGTQAIQDQTEQAHNWLDKLIGDKIRSILGRGEDYGGDSRGLS